MQEKEQKISAIICAAGKGERAGFNINKLLAPLFGAPALYHTLKKFDIPEIDEVIVTSSKSDYKQICALAKPFGYKVVLGGKTRTESVEKALKYVKGEIVLIHDGARPFVDKQLILNCIEAVEKFGSGVCAVKLTDTTVYAQYGEITGWLERDGLYRIQTPQGFLTEDICRAYSLAKGKTYTDDSAVYGEFIAPPRLVEGDENNIKLTYKSDFTHELPTLPQVSGSRGGIGVDVHAFGEGNSVKLAGVEIPCDRGLIAHSDGDVVYHAITDACLSAAGLKDIGHYFPDTDEKYAGADSGAMLGEVIKLIKEKGYAPVNISVTVQAEKPKLAPYINNMVKNISSVCGVQPENCAVAAGTCEKLGFVGEGLGIAAYCAVLLKENEK